MKIHRLLLTGLVLVAIFSLTLPSTQAAIPNAPARTFLYQVQRGETLATISRKFGVSPDHILDLNNLRTRPDLLFVGEQIMIPITLGTIPSYVNPFLYPVQVGDTVQTLANKFFIDKFTVRLVNAIPEKANLLTAGATLLIPAGPHRYVVQQGDTIQSIAVMFGTTVNNLLKFNAHLGSGASIFPGENVFVTIVFDAPFMPVPGALGSTSTSGVSGIPGISSQEGVGGGGEGTSSGSPLDPTTGIRPTDSSEVARIANANVISAFQTITMPQNVVNLGQQLQIRWHQLRRVRRDLTRDNGAIFTIAVQFRGGTGTVSVERWDGASIKGVPVIGIYVNPGDKELWNDIEVELPGNCESVSKHQIIITSGIKLESFIQYKLVCPNS